MSYQPESINSQDPKVLLEWVLRELRRVGDAIELGKVATIEFRAVVPVKLREGMICGADGTNWNPGSGKGVYCYYTGAWHLLG